MYECEHVRARWQLLALSQPQKDGAGDAEQVPSLVSGGSPKRVSQRRASEDNKRVANDRYITDYVTCHLNYD